MAKCKDEMKMFFENGPEERSVKFEKMFLG